MAKALLIPGSRCLSQNKSLNRPAMSDLAFPATTKDLMLTMFDDLPGMFSDFRMLSGSNFPSLDIKETKDNFEFLVDAPGIKKEDVKIEVRNQILKIVMERKSEKKNESDQFHRIERQFGHLQRSVRLPENIKDNEISAKYEDGVLHVVIPKSENSSETIKRIPVK
jgi:HSP20 family protein